MRKFPCVLPFIVVLGCGGGGATASGGSGEPLAEGSNDTSGGSTPAVGTTFAAQVTNGQRLYADHCARCHGAGGEGGERAPRVVGLAQGALPLDPPATAQVRRAQFRTVADVATFAVAEMPPQHGGSLPEADYWAILAFDLHANGIELRQPLDGALASTLVIPR